jgi:pimeloyl-ACP methyl ester carboxylesterase
VAQTKPGVATPAAYETRPGGDWNRSMRSMMNKTLKWPALAFAGLLALLLVGSYLNHRLRLPREIAAYPPPGELVAVNGHRLHVYGEASGEPTLVFLSGSGTTAPTLDFRGLYRRLAGDYRIVVVERAGYGWSDDSDTPRDIDTVLAETRLALQRAGESPPYVLLPHSMSGLEALHWAHSYPDEVAAIVGLDPAVPPVYAERPPPTILLRLAAFTARSGLLRLVPAICHASPAVSEGHLTAEETVVYCAMMYRRTWSPNMLAETEITQANARQVAAQGIPDVPLYLFISDGTDLPVPNWVELLIAYAEHAPDGRYELLDVTHYVHNLAADRVAVATRSFVESVVQSR